MAKRGNPEMIVQHAIIRYIRTVMPTAMINFTKNEINQRGKSAMIEIQRAKMNGVMSGWPDLTVLMDGQLAFFIEVKSAKGRVSPVQAEVHGLMRSRGFPVCVAKSVDDVRAFLKENKIPNNEVI